MIPIYRAKKISSEEFIEFESKFTHNNITYAVLRWTYGEVSGYVNEVLFPITHQIDPNTLAIHFPNMIDKNGKKIFASLSENCVGGDIVKDLGENTALVTFEEFCTYFVFDDETIQVDLSIDTWCEIIGIHKGENNE